MKLRPYQRAQVDAVFAEFQQVNSTLVVSPTGTGKTILAASIAYRVVNPPPPQLPKRVMFLAHRKELIYQAKDKIEKMTGLRAEIEMGDQRVGGTDSLFTKQPPIVVSSVQTQCSGGDGGGRMTKFDPAEFGLLIVDEAHHCFPFKTKILTNKGWIKIGDIVKNKNTLSAYSVDLRHGISEWKSIVGWHKNKKSQLVKIKHEHGELTCSRNHKIWTMGGYIEAKDIVKGTHLRVVQNGFQTNEKVFVCEKVLQSVLPIKMDLQQAKYSCASLGQEQKAIGGKNMRELPQGFFNDIQRKRKQYSSFLLHKVRGILENIERGIQNICAEEYLEIAQGCNWNEASRYQYENEIKQSNEKERRQTKNAAISFWKNVFSPRRKWKINRTSKENGINAWMANGTRNINDISEGTLRISSQMLQGGFSKSRKKDCCGNRRKNTSLKEVDVFGQKKDFGVKFSRVVSVEVVKRRSYAGPGKIDEEDNFLYDIEVEQNHNYFADGVLVSNSTSPIYRRIIDYYRTNPDLKVVGITATPDRGDEEALGQVFESVAYDYEILDAIHDGWLVPVDQQMITVADLDFSRVRTTAGDLNGADLASIMESERILQEIAWPTIEIVGDKRAIVFTASVKHAECLSDILNRHRTGMSEWVCGMTEDDKRKDISARFADGRIQIVCNCGIYTEGYDNPAVEVIVMGRPTKSRNLYAQMAGRSLRPLPGIVDGLETAEERKAAIAASPKKSALILDFVGNSGKHKLMTSADILGGKESQEVLDRAIARAKEGRVRMDQVLDEEEEKLNQERRQQDEEREERRLADIARRAHLVAVAKFSKQSVNPFDVLQITPASTRGWHEGKTLTEKQREVLRKQGIDPDSMPYAQSKQLIGVIFDRWNKKLCSYKQSLILQKRGLSTDVSFEEASRQITEIAQRENWKPRV